jgi:sugar phosphate permease
LIRLSN